VDLHCFRRLVDQAGVAREDARRRPQTALVVAVVSGVPGVGKTALAVHWGHRVRERFPDGQLFADLRGFDAIRPAVASDQVVRGFLAEVCYRRALSMHRQDGDRYNEGSRPQPPG
jgi:hypothetical protein